MDYSRLTTLLLISPLVRSKARSSFEKCSANLIQLQATLASPAYFHDGSYQPYPLTDSERANIFGSGNYQSLILSIILRKQAYEITLVEIPKMRNLPTISVTFHRHKWH